MTGSVTSFKGLNSLHGVIDILTPASFLITGGFANARSMPGRDFNCLKCSVSLSTIS
jgi:hypothetical protein